MKNIQNQYVARIHTKTAGKRSDLIKYCLRNPLEQYLAIGWSFVYKTNLKVNIENFNDYVEAIKTYKINVDLVEKYRKNPVLNVFAEAKKDDLFWTRDEDGMYWICRVKETAKAQHNYELDIGAVIPIEAYCYGKEVPGQIKASFNRPRGGTSERIYDAKIIEFSKKVFNEKSNEAYYEINTIAENDPIGNLPDFDLEELVILYIQKECGYHLLPSSIAQKSTSVKIECEFINNEGKRSVVQVKGGNDFKLYSSDYLSYLEKGYDVYLYAPKVDLNVSSEKTIGEAIQITKEEIRSFWDNNAQILPENITQWKYL